MNKLRHDYFLITLIVIVLGQAIAKSDPTLVAPPANQGVCEFLSPRTETTVTCMSRSHEDLGPVYTLGGVEKMVGELFGKAGASIDTMILQVDDRYRAKVIETFAGEVGSSSELTYLETEVQKRRESLESRIKTLELKIDQLLRRRNGV